MLSCTSGFRISKNKNGGDNLPQRYELIAYSDTYGYFFISSSLLKLRDSMMSNANTEYNILAVTSLEHRNTTLGYISLFFSFFLRERGSIHRPQFTHDRNSPTCITSSLQLEKNEAWDRQIWQWPDSSCICSMKPKHSGQALLYCSQACWLWKKQEYSFHLLNLHKKKIRRAYSLLASIKLTEK